MTEDCQDLQPTLTPKTGQSINYSVQETQKVEVSQVWGRLIAVVRYLDSVDLSKGSITFGRHESCDIVAHKKRFSEQVISLISKEHFLIEQEEQVVFLKDLSKNGTFINGKRIGQNKRNVLSNNDEIAIRSPKLILFVFKNYISEEKFLPDSLREQYCTVKMLGQGACGEVRLAINKYTCEKVAIKKIVICSAATSKMDRLNHPSKIEREICILQNLSHPCIISTKQIETTENEVFIVLELMEGGELNDRIHSLDILTEPDAKFLFYQMVLAVQYIHSKEVTHRDLKPENILLLTDAKETLVKIADFGLSNYGEHMMTKCGTLRYVAPEVLNNHFRDGYGEYGKEVDIWSMGVILFYMLSKKLPFFSKDQSDLAQQILKGSYNMEGCEWEYISTHAKNLIKKMLVVNPKGRITIEGILRHPWINRDLPMQKRVHSLLLQYSGFDCESEQLAELGLPEKKFRFSEMSETVLS